MGRDMQTQSAACRCGQVAFEVRGAPLVRAICYCDSCRTAGTAFPQASGDSKVVDDDGGTDLVLYRKDRVGPVRRVELLREHRLKPDSPTRRMVATCCNTPMFLEFTKGHWLSVYAGRLPDGVPPIEMRVMTADRPAGPPLPRDVPAYANHAPRFMAKLLAAWAAMGFRAPKSAW